MDPTQSKIEERQGKPEQKDLFEKAQAETPFAVQDWGLIAYAEALARQEDLVALVHQELARDTLVFCSHPPVVTLGRATQADDVDGWSGELMQISRGGRATYHGPSQLVIYPIFDLNHYGRDIHKFLRRMENAIVSTLASFGVQATGRTFEPSAVAGGVDATGVWVGDRKIASLGIAVRKWVTFHGAAINLDCDPSAFQGIRPCGFSPSTMVSFEDLTGQRVDREAFKKVTVDFLSRSASIS